MKIPNSRGSEDRKKIAAMAVFVLLATAIVYFEYFYTGEPATPTPASVTSAPAPSANNALQVSNPPPGLAAKTVGTTSAALDPTLRMDAMLVTESLEYSGSGRNIFSANSAPVEIQKPLASARIAQPAPVVVPCPPNCPPPPPPPPPPPIDLKFFGTATSPKTGARQAFLLHDDNVFLASPGDIVLRRYRVIAIEAKSIRVEDMQNKNTQTLPLLTN